MARDGRERASARPRRIAGDPRPTSAPKGWRRWRSACCTPTPTPVTNGRCWSVCASFGPRFRSWPRTRSPASGASTSAPAPTVLSAYVQPVAERYLEPAGASAYANGGFGGQLYIMQSNGGVDSVERTREIPITMVESGPASGFWGAAELGRLTGEPNVLALDIGGTTAKCSLIEGGQVRIVSDYWIERSRRSSAGYPVMVPVVDLVEIGKGGGSIAWVDEFGKLHVGPRSAGRRARAGRVRPGRRRRRRRPTRMLALGRIDPDYFCGGEIEADMTAVERALAAHRRRARASTHSRGCARHRADRQQQHDQRAEAGIAQPRPRPARFHAWSRSAAAAGCTRPRWPPSSASAKS